MTVRQGFKRVLVRSGLVVALVWVLLFFIVGPMYWLYVFPDVPQSGLGRFLVLTGHDEYWYLWAVSLLLVSVGLFLVYAVLKLLGSYRP
jgi:predicted ABC-type exoprotein transport system permease subunit